MNDNIDDWLIIVRVCQNVESTNPNTRGKYSLDMILMDEEVNKLMLVIYVCWLSFYNIWFVHHTCLLLILYGLLCINENIIM